MNAQVGIAILIGIGSALEIAGVLMVIKEIRADRRRADELRQPKRVSILPAVEQDEALPLSVVGGKPLSDEEHAARQAEARFRMLQATTHATRQEAQEAREAAAEAARMDAEHDEALRRFMHEQLTSGIGARVWGVALVLAGIACQTAAGLWSIGIA